MIKLYKETLALQNKLQNKSDIGFVPTMGNLHQGHISLIEKALKQNHTIVVSIYVNPTQFGDTTDYSTYPRTLTADLEKIKMLLTNQKTDQEIIVFAPSSDKEIYPQGKELIKAQGDIINYFEGELRPGHFDGMVTVVKRLFEIISPSDAYFGEKDYQQYLIVNDLAKKYFPNLTINAVKIARDETGLALSSRNQRLSTEQRKKALVLRSTLLEIKDLILANSTLSDVQNKINWILAHNQRFNYLALVNAQSLLPPESKQEKMVILGNYQIAEVKLLDNLCV